MTLDEAREHIGEAAARMRADADRCGDPPGSLIPAVAGWLDRFSDAIYCYGPAEFDHALAIARAYLGEAPDGR